MSKLEVDAIEPQSGTTLTIGASGDTITIPSGATLENSGIVTGFESTGIDDNAASTAITINSSNNVGIGTSSPDENLHIFNGSAGSVTANVASQLVIENSGDAGINILSPNTQDNWLMFGDADDNFVGGLRYSHPSNYLSLYANNAERMFINSSGNVGIGTSTPSYKLTILENANNFLQFSQSGDASAGSLIGRSSSTNLRIQNSENAATEFWTNNTERMRIDSSGNVLIGASSFASGSRVKQFEINASTIALRSGSASTAFQYHQEFHNPNGTIGSITTSGSATAFNTSSDYRLKENVNYDFDATTRLKQLKPARFNFIADANTTVDGFLAHEVQDVVPEAISGIKDATETKEKVVVNANGNVIAENIEQADWEAGKIADEEGKSQYPTDSTWEATKVVPVYQGIDQSKLVPLLVKTIQELEARITALEN